MEEFVSAIATSVSAVAAAIAAYLSFSSLQESRKMSQRQYEDAKSLAAEQRADDYVKRYLELAIQFPKLSTDDTLNQKDQQYDWFLSFILMMAREVMGAYPKDAKWEKQMLKQLSFNKDELSEWKKGDVNIFKPYGADVERLVEQAISGGGRRS